MRNPERFSRDELFEFHGIWSNHYYTDNWDNLQNFQAKPDDILIASFPKSGQTWTSYIIDLLCSGIPEENLPSSHISLKIPPLEINFPLKDGTVFTGVQHVNSLLTSPRLLKTHLPVQFVPKSFWEKNCKIVYVARNPKDVMVSFYHFDQMILLHPEPGEWSSFFQRFLEGKTMHGSWYDHINNWWKKKETYSNLHFVFYEDMVKDTKREIDRLCSFLGLIRSSEEKDIIKARVQFDEMKESPTFNYATFQPVKIDMYMRKGKVGDWKNYFTVTQNEEFDTDYKKKMENSTIQFCTEI
ncbi:cytosolic sulfotransferase 1-like [Boleophthalmus pectinirostris]|uniref:cytosolic sulfotransferase 1-like n=1 Tax=Boleophthalmus pectinirostris TaxID=150288 RepID=UPI0024313511|nr:cytosolic sulfotransferase 1-like [Boleophthalmus pectinirostris]